MQHTDVHVLFDAAEAEAKIRVKLGIVSLPIIVRAFKFTGKVVPSSLARATTGTQLDQTLRPPLPPTYM